MNDEKETLKRSRIIFGALGMGQLMFLVISLVMAKEPLIAVENTASGTWVFPGIAAFIALVLFFVYRRQLHAGFQLSSREARLKAYPAVQIFRFLGIESGTLLLIVAFYMNHQFVLVYFAALWLMIFFTLFPTSKQFEKFLDGGKEVFDR